MEEEERKEREETEREKREKGRGETKRERKGENSRKGRGGEMRGRERMEVGDGGRRNRRKEERRKNEIAWIVSIKPITASTVYSVKLLRFS